MYTTYVLQSEPTGRFYIGFSQDPEARILLHNAGRVRSTKPYRPWRLVYAEQYEESAVARRRERALKALKSHTAIEALILRGPLAQVVRAQS